jgi:peroxiredoxin
MRSSFCAPFIALFAVACSRHSEKSGQASAAPSATALSAASAVATGAPPPVTSVVTPARRDPVMLAHLSPAWGKHGKLPPGVGVAVGQLVPDVSGMSTDGSTVGLRALAQQGPYVLVFYRGAFCHFAAYQLRALAVRAAQFEKAGVPLVLVSPDASDTMRETRDVHGIKWTMLADPERTIIKAFKLEHELTDADLDKIQKYKMLVPPPSPGRERAVLTKPAVFVVDGTGRVRFAHADEDSEKMLHPDQILDGIKQTKLGN